jgi:hypothetical protein
MFGSAMAYTDEASARTVTAENFMMRSRAEEQGQETTFS